VAVLIKKTPKIINYHSVHGVDSSEYDHIENKFFQEGLIAHAPLDHLTCADCNKIAQEAVENYAKLLRS
jgi:hypothetical protein